MKKKKLLLYIAYILTIVAIGFSAKYFLSKTYHAQKDIGIEDIDLISQNFGKEDFDKRADLNKDGKVDAKDLELATKHYGGKIK